MTNGKNAGFHHSSRMTAKQHLAVVSYCARIVKPFALDPAVRSLPRLPAAPTDLYTNNAATVVTPLASFLSEVLKLLKFSNTTDVSSLKWARFSHSTALG